jgi:hypothetical protein
MPLLTISAACGDDSAVVGGAGGDGSADGAGGAGASVSQGGSPGTGGEGGDGSGGAPASQAPRIGAHGLAFFGYGANQLASIDSPALNTQPTGSTLIVSAGRGDFSAFAVPTDNKGNGPFAQIGTAHTYTNWPGSGTAAYSLAGALGGSDHIVTNSNAPGDEITLAVVEVMSSSHVQDAQWVERLNGQPITSAPVTTTGPATLVAFWWGDAGVDEDKVAVPDNGFEVLDSIGQAGSLVQCFVAAKEVDAAGSYDVTWDATPAQGAQLWLIAVQ